ncbi:hypothetical protein FRC14_008157 [Serendipita sp. 396]|nr:hypothetical protein FRC14_008157 [Serendipita sp. 396]KAG8786762.1 hypothetical protein FRC15_010766 [Serendipita sp. 397]KAG8799960.1 hypothetical protein FRC16_004022 [Serendipita sp. 398]KAG8832927.1 hypothetical protein FRC18_004400 [Serendipita sp. 400]KAG8854267.1 hypothetical protein FRB91_003805 [Serendipita sp. 411]
MITGKGSAMGEQASCFNGLSETIITTTLLLVIPRSSPTSTRLSTVQDDTNPSRSATPNQLTPKHSSLTRNKHTHTTLNDLHWAKWTKALQLAGSPQPSVDAPPLYGGSFWLVFE